MIPGQEETRLTGDETGSKTVRQPTKPNRITPTQTDRVRRMLSRGWICGIEFLNPPDGLAPILRYTGRIHELRKAGFYVDRRPCANTFHRHGPGVQLWEWHIVGHVDDGTLPGIGGA